MVAVPAGGLMKITPEDILTGGLGLVVALFGSSACSHGSHGCAGSVFGTLWERLQRLCPTMSESVGQVSLIEPGEARGSVSYSGGLRACPPKK